MLNIGQYNTLTIKRSVSFGFYLETESEWGDILFPIKYAEKDAKIGDQVHVFVYPDSEDRLVATTEKPFAVVGEFACLEVSQTTPIGAFMKWGLLKDLFVPLSEQHHLMEIGEFHVVRICLDDRTNRLIGVGKIGAFLNKTDIKLKEGQAVELLPYEETTLGIMCIIDNEYAGMLYKNEVFQELEVGEKIKGYVKKVREDNKIDLSIRVLGFDGIRDQADIILDKLAANNGFLPFNDSSSSEEISKIFQMSKKTFKKLIGNLFRRKRIKITEKGIELFVRE
ncbi:MAG: GntR family transcriptional regulator [Bacteroidetes bacterium]|nr:MAG: GntR family transcriptional regulator [Bacteroidota bacterium]